MEKFKKVIAIVLAAIVFMPIGAVVTGLRAAFEFFHFKVSQPILTFLRRLDRKHGPELVDKVFDWIEGPRKP